VKKLSIMDDKVYWKYIKSKNTEKKFFGNLINDIQFIKNYLADKYSFEEMKLIKAHAISMEKTLGDVALLAVIITFLLGLGALGFKEDLTKLSQLGKHMFLSFYMVIFVIIFGIILTRRHRILVATTLVKEIINDCLEEREEENKLK